MASQKPKPVPNHEITGESAYFNRRTFMRAGIVAAAALATGVAYRELNPSRHGVPPHRGPLATSMPTTFPSTTQSSIAAMHKLDEPLTSFDDITNYNNFYEFSTDKHEVAELAANFVARPWSIAIGGLCSKPATFDLDDILKSAPIEERVYRMRCVEAWSMVIPWNGFSLSKLLDRVQPLSSAKYVGFTTLNDPEKFPGQRRGSLDWPYVEGLRMDEAMHPLTMLASGIYGKWMPPQDGAPLRLVVPWKYGFKGIKSIVKIDLVASEPPTTWNLAASNEYGFYANVNPNVPHPRWSQATERRIGGSSSKPTLLFNGYADQVGSLYSGMDLTANF